MKIKGLDGSWVKEDTVSFPYKFFESKDLSKKVDLKGKWDMAISLEVAEHIKEENSDVFVDNLCNASDIILFSAAVPLTGGTDHVNEQYASYWISKFAQHNYKPIDCVRGKYWNNTKVLPCYKQNIILFCDENRYEELCQKLNWKLEEYHIWDIVCPEYFAEAKDPDKLINRMWLMYHMPKLFY